MKENEQPEQESPTARWERKHPWYKRPEFLTTAFGGIISAVSYGLWVMLASHIADAWNIGENDKRIEKRVYRIEKALHIEDPVPFSASVTNIIMVYDTVAVTTNTNIVDP